MALIATDNPDIFSLQIERIKQISFEPQMTRITQI